jgi:hypothetical protein
MFVKKVTNRDQLPEKAQLSKYYEMDGALRAYANRMAVLGLVCGSLAITALGLFAYVRLQPPVVIRVDGTGEASVVAGETIRVGNGILKTSKAPISPDSSGSAPSDIYQVFAAKEIHRLNTQRIEHTEKMVCRYQVRLVYSGRTTLHPTGLLVGEFWEQQMVGEKNIDLQQRSLMLDRGEEVQP